MGEKTQIGVVYGGKSGEHQISIQTAFAVINAFDHTKYEILPYYITPSGEWRSGAAIKGPLQDKKQLLFGENGSGAFEEPLVSLFAPSLPHAREVTVSALRSSSRQPSRKAEVMFPLLHGTNGEDGTIQGLFEIANIPYVGAGVLASAMGMDKAAMKSAFAQAGLPQCVYRHFVRREWENHREEWLMEIEIALGYPCFVKPANLGSSVGISKASNQKELIAAVELAFTYDRKVIVEEFVEAREVEVAVLGNDEPEASVCGEIISSSDFYDYKAKYIDGKSAMVIPAELDADKAEEIRSMALKAFKAIDGSGLARVDFFVRKLDGKVFINEINTMPGFTPFSMYPLLWKESGKSYRELLDDLIKLAIERYEDKQQIQFGFEA